MSKRINAPYPLTILTHPTVFAALGLFLLNDHVLRRLWPSPITGKLGDFACMFFMPLVVAAILGILIPARPRLAGPVAFALVGGLFGAAKTLAPVHAATVAAVQAIFGSPVGWRLDPTDLLALLALPLAWWLWDRASRDRRPLQIRGNGSRLLGRPEWLSPAPRDPLRALRASRPSYPSCLRGPDLRGPDVTPAPLAVLAVTLAALLTVADSPAPDLGIYSLSAHDDQIWAASSYYSYTSTDGGLTWQSTGGGIVPRAFSAEGISGTLRDPNRPQMVYRFAPGQAIEASADGGATWQVAYQASESEAADAYYRSTRSGSPYLDAIPRDGVIDPKTGNVVFAMGQAGVLVHPPAGGWQAVAVGDYAPFDPGTDVLALLLPELVVAAGLALLAASVLALRAGRPRIRKALVVVGALGWAFGALLIPEFMHGGGYGGLMAAAVALAGGLLLLPLAAYSAFQVGASALPALGRLALAALAAALLFLLPFVLWASEALPSHAAALAFACLLGLAAVAAGYYWLGPLPARSSAPSA